MDSTFGPAGSPDKRDDLTNQGSTAGGSELIPITGEDLDFSEVLSANQNLSDYDLSDHDLADQIKIENEGVPATARTLSLGEKALKAGMYALSAAGIVGTAIASETAYFSMAMGNEYRVFAIGGCLVASFAAFVLASSISYDKKFSYSPL